MGPGIVHRGSTAQAGDSLAGARDMARRARDLLRQDIDPLVAREQQREAERQAAEDRKAAWARDHGPWPAARATTDYHQRVIEPTRTPRHAAQWILSLENRVPVPVWNAPIADVTAPRLLAALEQVRPHERSRNLKGATVPETLRRIRQRLGSVFEDAQFHERCTANPAAAVRRKLREQGRTVPAASSRRCPIVKRRRSLHACAPQRARRHDVWSSPSWRGRAPARHCSPSGTSSTSTPPPGSCHRPG
jgi:Phage integrase central domain